MTTAKLYAIFCLLTPLTPGFTQQLITPETKPLSMQSDANNSTLFVGPATSTTSGASANTFLGYQAGQSTTSGSQNTFVGFRAGSPNTVGNRNTFVGYQIGQINTDGSDNVYMGYNAGGQHRRGSRNTGIGTGTAMTSEEGTDNTLIGAQATGVGINLTNATAIGANARVTASNSLVLGDNANVGIGTSAPTARLEINSGADHESGLQLSRLTANSPAQLAMADKVLTVDSTGRVVLAPAGRLRVRSVADWSDNVFAPAYQLQSLAGVAEYIRTHRHLPGVLPAEEVVRQGIDAGKMVAKLLEKIEELTLYAIQLEKMNQQQAQDLQALKSKQTQLEAVVGQLVKRH